MTRKEKEQHKKFVRAAKDLGLDESEKSFDAAVKQITPKETSMPLTAKRGE